jgi:hypothetical protein
MKNFKDYRDHHLVRCFVCARAPGSAPVPNDGASGRWSQFCDRCQTSTFYDLRSETPSHRVVPRRVDRRLHKDVGRTA